MRPGERARLIEGVHRLEEAAKDPDLAERLPGFAAVTEVLAEQVRAAIAAMEEDDRREEIIRKAAAFGAKYGAGGYAAGGVLPPGSATGRITTSDPSLVVGSKPTMQEVAKKLAEARRKRGIGR